MKFLIVAIAAWLAFSTVSASSRSESSDPSKPAPHRHAINTAFGGR